jgi:putative hemolysin
MENLVALPEMAPRRRFAPGHEDLEPFLLRENGMELRLAKGTSETLEAQKLRFEVFHRELRLGLISSRAYGLDQDVYDHHCDHLLVIDTDRDCLVGTYRLLPYDRVPSFGFYSESEFDLSNLKCSGLRLLELGRSCVAQEYRDGRVIRLLFKGIAEYLRMCGADALMGCASVYGAAESELSAIQRMLLRDHLSASELRVTPRRGFDVPPLPVTTQVDDSSTFRKLPPLFKGYLRLGAKVCGPPAYDRQFGTTDFLVLARTADIVQRYGRHFLA